MCLGRADREILWSKGDGVSGESGHSEFTGVSSEQDQEYRNKICGPLLFPCWKASCQDFDHQVFSFVGVKWLSRLI